MSLDFLVVVFINSSFYAEQRIRLYTGSLSLMSLITPYQLVDAGIVVFRTEFLVMSYAG